MTKLERMLWQYLLEEDARRQNRLVDIERAYWWHGFDVFGTFEVLEAKIALEVYGKISDDLHELLRLFGSDAADYTK